jgi:hypothetical protein
LLCNFELYGPLTVPYILDGPNYVKQEAEGRQKGAAVLSNSFPLQVFNTHPATTYTVQLQQMCPECVGTMVLTFAELLFAELVHLLQRNKNRQPYNYEDYNVVPGGGGGLSSINYRYSLVGYILKISIIRSIFCPPFNVEISQASGSLSELS